MKELSKLQGTVGNVIVKRMKDIEKASSNGTKDLVPVMKQIFKEEDIESNPYTETVITALKAKKPLAQYMFLYNIVLKGDGLGVI